MLGAALGGAGLVLSGCVVEQVPPGPVVPTPTVGGGSDPPVTVTGNPGRWSGRSLRVMLPGDDAGRAVASRLLAPYAAATGAEVVTGYTDYAALSGDDAGADLALVDARWATLLGAGGRLGAVPAAAAEGTTPDLVAVLPGAVPAYADAIVSAFRPEAVAADAVPRSWAMWWDTRGFPGGRTLAKGPVGTFEFSLLADGVAPGELYPLDLERAVDGLRRVSGSIVDRWWETGQQAVDWIAGGRAAMGSAYARQVYMTQRGGRAIEAVWNEGALSVDHWVIPVGATGADVARDFLGWALSAATQATLATSTGLAPVSASAVDALDPLTRSRVATGPANLPRLFRLDVGWWVENRIVAFEAFNDWLLGDPRGF